MIALTPVYGVDTAHKAVLAWNGVAGKDRQGRARQGQAGQGTAERGIAGTALRGRARQERTQLGAGWHLPAL
jgi:hypothetical protein